MHVVHAGTGLVRAEHHVAVVENPIVLLIDRIDGDLAKVVGIDEVLQRLRSLLLVKGVVVDSFAHGLQIFFQDRFARVLHSLCVNAGGHSNQDGDDRDDDHQLNEGETALRIGVDGAPASARGCERKKATSLHHFTNLGHQSGSPIGIFRSIHSRSRGLGIDVEDVFAAPGCGVGVVLDSAQSPIGFFRHGVDGDTAEELNLLSLSA